MDIRHGVSDGARFISFQTAAKMTNAPCYGTQGCLVQLCPPYVMNLVFPNQATLSSLVSMSSPSSRMNAGVRVTLRITGLREDR